MQRRFIAALLFAGTLSGCISTDGPETGGMRANYGQSFGPPSVPGVKGPYGEGVPMAAPYNTNPPGSEHAARMLMNMNQPMSRVQINPPGAGIGGPPGMNMPNAPMPPYGILSPPGVPGMPGGPSGNPLMKTSMPGMADGGVVNANVPPFAKPPGGLKQAQFANSSPAGSLFPAQRTQVFFPKPAGMKIFWFTQGPDGKPNYSTTALETPGRYNFAQGAIYRLKLTHLPGRPALELYPTLEVVPTSPRTNEFLAHNSVPVEFTEEDFKQVVDRNYIVKVIYLPDPQFQDAAGAGPDEIVSTRLEPGQDPIQEALRRGSILLVLRIGNIDQGLQHSPATTAPIPGGPAIPTKPPGVGVLPFNQVPYPVTPITPGGPPNQLPPNLSIPKLPAPEVKAEVKPEAKGEKLPALKDEGIKNEANKLSIPPLNIPAPPELKIDDGSKPAVPAVPAIPTPASPSDDKLAVPPIPAPAEKTDREKGTTPIAPALPNLPVIPASSSKEVAPTTASPSSPTPIVLPTLPAMDPTTAPRPELPSIPVLPVPKQ